MKFEKFPAGARVMFLGDSITHNGAAMARIQDYYAEKFPEDKVKFYNAGISGGGTPSARRYLDLDLALFRPTHVVVMLGMNDIWRGLYWTPGNQIRTMDERNTAYFDGMKEICDRLAARGIRIVLCTPTPFDDRMEAEIEAGRDLSQALAGYGFFCRGLAVAYDAPVVDYSTEMTSFNRDLQEIDPKASLIGSGDRVHPTPGGQAFMAKVFLRAQGFDVALPTAEEYLKDAPLPELSAKNAVRWECENLCRNLRATEYFLTGDKWDAPAEEKYALIKAFAEKPEPGPHAEYFTRLANQYLENGAEAEAHNARLLALTDALYD